MNSSLILKKMSRLVKVSAVKYNEKKEIMFQTMLQLQRCNIKLVSECNQTIDRKTDDFYKNLCIPKKKDALIKAMHLASFKILL